MLDADLAEIYKAETSRLNEAVKRNIDRFPPEFMFQLTKDEYENLKSQFATSKSGLALRTGKITHADKSTGYVSKRQVAI